VAQYGVAHFVRPLLIADGSAHQCSPNCFPVNLQPALIVVSSVVRVCLFAARDIAPHSQLTFAFDTMANQVVVPVTPPLLISSRMTPFCVRVEARDGKVTSDIQRQRDEESKARSDRTKQQWKKRKEKLEQQHTALVLARQKHDCTSSFQRQLVIEKAHHRGKTTDAV
jgi:hypothetical protein